MTEKTTSEVARCIGVAPDVLRKWKYRGLLKLAPGGVSGQGRSIECMWSDEAVAEAKELAEDQTRKKHGRPQKRFS